MKDQFMTKLSLLLALASAVVVPFTHAISLDDIQLWTGSGTNRAALVIEWNSPIVFNNTSVPAPIADKTLVWGYRFNGANAAGTDMLHAVLAADPRLYVVVDDTYGTFVEGIGYHLKNVSVASVSDGTNTSAVSSNGIIIDPPFGIDAAFSLNTNDLYWGGYDGPYWQLWNESGDTGGFTSSPDRGTNQFWNPDTYSHGQWDSAYDGLDDLQLTNGSWIGFTVSGAGYDSNTNDTAATVFDNDEEAPASPDGTYFAYVMNTNDFATQIISTNGVDAEANYNDPAAMLGEPTLKFLDYYGTDTLDRSKLIEPPYWTAADGSDVITIIDQGGEVTLKLGRKVYDDPNNPYGIDLIIYGNSFLSFTGGAGGFSSDTTDFDAAKLGTGINGHDTVVSVSQDGTNWFTYPVIADIFPFDSYRWDEPNHAWQDEVLNFNKPLNPSSTRTSLSGLTIASALDQFVGAAGGSGYDLKASGFPWIQYVRLQTGTAMGDYTVIDAISAVNPAVVGDALSITPSNILAGVTNLVFQDPANPGSNQICLGFASVSDLIQVSTVSLSDFSSFAPVAGYVSSAYQITASSLTSTNPVSVVANVALQAGANYHGNGGDLRVRHWTGTNWDSPAFTYNATNNQVLIPGVTNFSAFVVAQLVAPQVAIQPAVTPGGFNFQVTPLPNVSYTLERSTDLITWTSLMTITPTNSQPITLQDTNAPADKAFYRLQLN
jgi:hypothetical protein